MLRANDIVPRNPEPLAPQKRALDTPSTSQMSTRMGEQFKVKKEADGSGSDTDDEDSIKEKALLVCFRFSRTKATDSLSLIDFVRLKFRDARLRLRGSGREGT